MAQPSRVPLAEIVQAVAVSPTQAAAIVWQVSARLEHWIRIKQPPVVIVPSFADLALDRGGSVWWHRGRVLPCDRTVEALGALLGTLLDAASQGRAAAGLVYILARATDERHLAPLTTVEAFRAAIARHAGRNPAVAVDGLLAQFFMSRAGLAPLGEFSTIADVRRHRRAGGIALPTIAKDTGIPISLLRELEWGVYANWTLAHAQPSVEAYATRAGLDPAAVAAIMRREQFEHVAMVPVRAEHERRRDRAAFEQALPYGLAALIVAVLAIAAPNGRPQSRVTNGPRATATIALEPTAAVTQVRETVTPAPSVERASPTRRHPRDERAVVRRPHGARPVVRAPRKTAPPLADGAAPDAAKPESALQRFARTIAGNGRYKVEPFPKPDDP